MFPSLTSFADELEKISLEKTAASIGEILAAKKSNQQAQKPKLKEFKAPPTPRFDRAAFDAAKKKARSVPPVGFLSKHRGKLMAAGGTTAVVGGALALHHYHKKQWEDLANQHSKTAAVKPYQQKTQYSCSAACLKAVLEHWGADRYAEHEIMHAIGVRDKAGAEVDEITKAAKKLGFDAYDKCFSSLDEAAKVVPIIADFQSFNNPGKGHYVVITEIGDDVVHLMDPNTDGNERTITRAECERRWWDRTMSPPHSLRPKWGVVVTPPGKEKVAVSSKLLARMAMAAKKTRVPRMSALEKASPFRRSPVNGLSPGSFDALRQYATKGKMPKSHFESLEYQMSPHIRPVYGDSDQLAWEYASDYRALAAKRLRNASELKVTPGQKREGADLARYTKKEFKKELSTRNGGLPLGTIPRFSGPHQYNAIDSAMMPRRALPPGVK